MVFHRIPRTPRKLEERLQELNAAHVREVNPRPVVHRRLSKNRMLVRSSQSAPIVGQIDRRR